MSKDNSPRTILGVVTELADAGVVQGSADVDVPAVLVTQSAGEVTLADAGTVPEASVRRPGSSITDMRIVCAGAGSAGLGVCQQIVDGMVEAGLPREEAMKRFVVVSSQGAIGRADGVNGDPNHARGLSEDRVPWVSDLVSDGASLLEVVEATQPTCLLGLAAQPDIFTEEVRLYRV